MHRTTRLARLGVVALVATTLAAGCQSYDALQPNPNVTTTAPAASILTGLLLDLQQSPWSANQRINQFHVLTESYYGNQDYRFGEGTLRYGDIRNLHQMDLEAARVTSDTTLDPYVALGKFLRAYYFVDMTRQVGDLPLTDALKASSGVFQPAYDTQKSIYVQALQWLDQANAQLAAIIAKNPGATVSGDIYFGGDLRKWQKVVNSEQLRVLVSLSHHADDPDLKVRQRFAAIVNNPATYPVETSNNDNLQINWIANQQNAYPIYVPGTTANTFQQRNPLGQTYLNILIATQDPRIFVVAAPTDSARNSGDPGYASKFTSYRGGNTGTTQADLKKLATAGKLSSINPSYFYTQTGEPTILLGWPETEFNIAEGINRGWAGGDAGAHYAQGIKASMQHYGVPSAQVTTFLAQPSVQYAGNTAAGLQQILTQKYVAFFENSGLEAYYNQRRTGVPVFSVGPANANNARVPLRWRYPQTEFQTNGDNVKTAVQRQYNGTDDINAVMWLLRDQ